MGEPELVGQPPRQRALAGGGRAIDRDDKGLFRDPGPPARVVRAGKIAAVPVPAVAHGASIKRAPSRVISGTKSGKLVAIGLASSIRTGSRAARPSTRNAIAMRWSSRVAIRAPPCGGP